MSATATAANSTKQPKKWWQVYTTDKECRLFKALARGTSEWRTTDGLMKAARLTQNEVESLCNKYVPQGIIQQHSKEPNKWRYWERATKKKKSKGTISGDDKKRRIDDKIKSTPKS